MSNSDIRVVPGPANYFSHPGSLERLSDFFNADQLASGVGLWRARSGRRRTFSAGGLPPAGGEKDPLYRPLQRTRRGGAGAGLR